jgi:hypothetical protein
LYRRESSDVVVGWGSPTRPIKETPMFGWATKNAEEEITTDLDVLVEYAESFDESKFSGAILHVSRCGSTALANAFKAIPHTLVLSEPDVFSQLIRETRWGGAAVPDDQRQTLVKGFLAAVLKEHPANSIIVKCSSISTITLEQTLSYMPKVPWCFVSRSPADVMASLERSPGMWLRTQEIRDRLLRRIGRESSHIAEAERSRDLYAFLLERFFLAAMQYADEDAIFIDYAQFGLDAVCDVVMHFLKRQVDGNARKAIAESLRFYSKAVVPTPFVATRPSAAPTGYPNLDSAYARYRAFIAAFEPHRANVTV